MMKKNPTARSFFPNFLQNKGQSIKEEDTIDTRIEFISEYVVKALKQKPEKWSKFMAGDEKTIMLRFFEMSKYDVMVFRVNTAGMISVTLSFPPLSRSKLVYFLRNIDDKITRANCRMAMTVGELSANVLVDLSIMADEVIGPMLCNPENQKGWPTVVKNDMKKHVSDLRNLLHQLKGEMSSQIMLPMPDGVQHIYHAEAKLAESRGQEVDLHLKTNIEGAVIKWAQQVHDLLHETSNIAFKRTKFPLPSADLNFYATRLRNLDGIYAQLRDPRVKRMAHYLQATSSVYIDCFKTMLTNIVAALLREVCNLMIQQCNNFVDPPSLFQGEADDQLIKLKTGMGIMDHFIEVYEMNRDKVYTFFPGGVTPVAWSFDFDRVFRRFNLYMKKLKLIEEILAATVEILKLEKMEFCGLRGKILSTECSKVLEDYQFAYANLSNITYDPSDPEDDTMFQADYVKHMKVLEDIDRRLAALFSHGLDECQDLDHIFKFFQIVGDLYHRPIITKELQPKLQRMLSLMHSNLDSVKAIYDEEVKRSTASDKAMVDPYLPPTAGVLWWIYKLRRRIIAPMDDFILFEDPIVESENAIYLKQKHNEMLTILKKSRGSHLQAVGRHRAGGVQSALGEESHL
ncbi:Dynein beta chain, ciliary [Eumeta japonica]|uniref:Dynein beta chain, ciliary n=1 Tax=Eumeta variegata TaxID=151549 RepID=A0A4C1XDB4_EUMVA|nr:Dynein beta chain, ciliary [Eumeta japonica]